MSKAIFVMDMPERCSKCRFSYEFQGIKKCQLMNVLFKGKSELSQNNFAMDRHEECPLRKMPEKKEADVQPTYPIPRRTYSEYSKGWNDCVDEIARQQS